MVYVINSFNAGSPVIASQCSAVKANHGFTMPVLFDPLNTINGPPWNYPQNHHFSLMVPGNEIVYQGSSTSQMESALEAILGN
jgi:hypothetical protein